MCAMPAMRAGGSLTMEERVSPRLLRNQREFQAIQRAWSLGWEDDGEPLHEVEIHAHPRAVEPRYGGRVATFFSGGVDSWATVLNNPDITDLIFVRGPRPDAETLPTRETSPTASRRACAMPPRNSA